MKSFRVKTLSTVVALSTVLFLADNIALPAKDANAGIVVSALFANKNEVIAGVGGTAFVLGGGWLIGTFYGFPGMGITITAMVLNADGSLSQGELAQSFSTRYPFIDNTDVASAMARAINDKYETQRDERGNAVVTFSVAETRAIVAPAGLSEEQILMIAEDLK